MYTVKLIELINAGPSLKNMEEKNFSVKEFYSLVKIEQKYNENYEFYAGAMKQLLEKYVEKEDENSYKLTEDKLDFCYKNEEARETFINGTKELDNIEVTIDGDKISLNGLEEANLTFEEVKRLYPFIEV